MSKNFRKVFALGLVFVSAIFIACGSDEKSIAPEYPTSSANEMPTSSAAGLPASSSFESQASSAAAVIPAPSSSSVIPELSSSSISDPIGDQESNILWSDEFNGATIDTTKWSFEIGRGENGWGNNEQQYYTGRTVNAYIKDGLLHIRANKERYEGAGYTSARIVTKGKFNFTYGTVEARIALPAGKGIWPAFWMLGANIDQVSWPTCGEIDIIEAVNDEHVIYGTHHWAHEGQHAEYGNSTKNYYGTSKGLDITEFHTYKMTWTKNAIAMYVDDFKYQEIDITLKNETAPENSSEDMATFHKSFFFILNVAVGGTWPGFEIDDAQFPNEMLVDYVRIYRN